MEDKSNLLPERAGQADVMTVAGGSSLMEPDPDAGHWYSPAAVRVILQAASAAERARCSAEFVENGRAIGRLEEREACVGAIQRLIDGGLNCHAVDCIEAIRLRGAAL